jgi:hypothetical protein
MHIYHAQALLAARRRQAGVNYRPHAPVVAENGAQFVSQLAIASPAPSPDKNRSAAISTRRRETVKVYPHLALGMLDAELTAAGRIYWLLRYIDLEGRGWVHVDDARQKLTRKHAPLRVCGWRRLRQLLHEGQDILWKRDGVGRIWLTGAARMAQKLDIERLAGKPVDLPVKALLGGMRQVRAHFYASSHSGRRTENPISRATLREITSVPERTQLDYDKAAGVARQQNIAIGPRYSQEAFKKQAWERGTGVFRFFDNNGNQGAPHREYVAWQLPNSYTGPHRQCAKGRQKKINQRLADLVHITGTRGNDQERIVRLFYPHGAAADRQRNDTPQTQYWSRGESRHHVQLWCLWSAG